MILASANYTVKEERKKDCVEYMTKTKRFCGIHDVVVCDVNQK